MDKKSLSRERDALLARGDVAGADHLFDAFLDQRPAEDELIPALIEMVSLRSFYSNRGSSGHRKTIAGWLNRVEAEFAGTDELNARLRVLQFAMNVAHVGFDSSQHLAAEIDWTLTERDAWVRNVRVFLLTRTGQLDEARALALSPSTPDDDDYFRGVRMALLSMPYVDRTDLGGFQEFAGEAFVCLERCESLLAQHRLTELVSYLARLHLNLGDLQTARNAFEQVAQYASLHPMVGGFRRSFSDLALLNSQLGRRDRAEAVLADYRSDELQSEPSLHDIRHAVVSAQVALEASNSSLCNERMARAAELLERLPHERYQAHLDVTRALALMKRIEDGAEAGTDDPNRNRARQFLQDAESAFRQHASRGGAHGLSRTLIAQGHLHLLCGELREAFEVCGELRELARVHGDLPSEARAITLKSFLLLELSIEHSESLYEEVLRELGKIHDPELRFQALANLYLHTWDLAEQHCDLTGEHLRQLDGLRQHIPAEEFDALYTKYVSARVLDRYVQGPKKRRLGFA
ncbi:MAG: hypothetical protein AAF517_00820 [Planctomycetota bacterium]